MEREGCKKFAFIHIYLSTNIIYVKKTTTTKKNKPARSSARNKEEMPVTSFRSDVRELPWSSKSITITLSNRSPYSYTSLPSPVVQNKQKTLRDTVTQFGLEVHARPEAMEAKERGEDITCPLRSLSSGDLEWSENLVSTSKETAPARGFSVYMFIPWGQLRILVLSGQRMNSVGR